MRARRWWPRFDRKHAATSKGCSNTDTGERSRWNSYPASEVRGGVATVGSNSLPKRPCPTSALRFPVTSCALPTPNPSDRSPRGRSSSGLVALNLLRFLWLFALGERYLVDCIKCRKLLPPHQRMLSRICWKERRMRLRCALRLTLELFFKSSNLIVSVGLENTGD